MDTILTLAGLGFDVYNTTQAPPGYYYDQTTGRFLPYGYTGPLGAGGSLFSLLIVGLLVWLVVKKG